MLVSINFLTFIFTLFNFYFYLFPPLDIFQRFSAFQFLFAFVAHKDAVFQVFRLDYNGAALPRAFDDRFEKFLLDLPLPASAVAHPQQARS